MATPTETDMHMSAARKIFRVSQGQILNSMGAKPLFREVIVAPGEALEVHKDDIGPSANDNVNDLGQYEVTQDPADRWKYRTPSLRNIALTAPYMHDGSLSTLREVIEFYNHGGAPNPVLDPLIKPLALNKREVDDIIAFLNALTSDHVSVLAEDARSIPIGERH